MSTKEREIITDLVRACGSGLNWMEQVDRARLSTSTRRVLHVDMGMCHNAIRAANKYLSEQKCDPNEGAIEIQR